MSPGTTGAFGLSTRQRAAISQSELQTAQNAPTMQTISFDQACANVTTTVIEHASASALAVERANVRADTATNRLAEMESSIQGCTNYVSQQALRTRLETEDAVRLADNALGDHREAAQSETMQMSAQLRHQVARPCTPAGY